MVTEVDMATVDANEEEVAVEAKDATTLIKWHQPSLNLHLKAQFIPLKHGNIYLGISAVQSIKRKMEMVGLMARLLHQVSLLTMMAQPLSTMYLSLRSVPKSLI